MAPTICSGKKRQTRTIAITNIRRHGQGSHPLNQALSNIVNFVANGSLNPRISGSLRIQAQNPNTNTTGNYRNRINEAGFYNNHLTQIITSPASNHRRQQFSFISDNAVTSSAHSDTENSFDLRLAHEILTNDSTGTHSSNTNITSLPPSSILEISSLSSHKENTSSPTSSTCQERIFKRYSKQGEDNENNESSLYEKDNYNKINLNKTSIEIHSSNMRQHYFPCNDFGSDEDDEDENSRELKSNLSSAGSDADMDTNESDSLTSLDTEKSAKLKVGNNPLLKDKLLAKQQINNNQNSNSNNTSSNTKSLSNVRNTDGLLSIAIKTIKLVQRNQLLQQRLTQLQLETSEFIQSVLANPENRHFRENIKQTVQKVDNV